MKEIVVAVSGINSVDNPGSGIGIIRSLKDAGPGYRCIGLSYDAMDPGLYLDQYVEKAFLLPYPSASPEKYLERLVYVLEENHVEIIIPAFDSEIPHYIAMREILEKKKIKLLLPGKEQFERTNKAHLPALGEKMGVKVPASYPVSSLEELNSALGAVGFPAMIKGVFYEAYIAGSYYEAQTHFTNISKKWGLPVLVQKFIAGNDYNLVGLAGSGGISLGMVCAKKLLLTQLGKIWTAVTIDNPRMLDMGRRFIAETGFTGGFEMEFRIAPDDEIYLLEINPRFPAWIYLATASGINLPERYILHLTENRNNYDQRYQVGKLLVRYTGELIRDISDFEKITLTGEKI